MANQTMIPILPCRSIKDTLAFYLVMGFEITYQHERPNTYACVKCGGIDLHFFTLKRYEPAQSYSSCLILSDDLDSLYQQFVASLRQSTTASYQWRVFRASLNPTTIIRQGIAALMWLNPVAIRYVLRRKVK